MSEISLHTANFPKSYSRKMTTFLGEFRVVYNYILSIYYIFSTLYATDILFNVKV